MALPGLEARADRFDDTLRFMRVAHSDRLSARLLRGIVVSTGEKRVANEDHVSDRDAKGFLELTDPIGLVDPRSGDVDGGGAAQMDRECGNQRRKNRFYRLALCEVGIPFFLFVQGRRRTPSRKRDLAVSVFDRFAPMPVRPEAGLPHRLIESADNCLLFVDVEILGVEILPRSVEAVEFCATGGKKREPFQPLVMREESEHLFFELHPSP